MTPSEKDVTIAIGYLIVASASLGALIAYQAPKAWAWVKPILLAALQ